ncbi:MAG TPA: alpha/beta fold hydrolase [Vicinamibacterales bacterium]|nr:alpha/beta fold hydrolase [Vicinamibacterales bacterium]
MRFFYFTCALAVALTAPAALHEARAEAAQQAPAAVKPTGYTVFLRGTPVGREEVTVREDATGTTITAQGRLGAPLNVVTRRAEMKYTADGTPERFSLDGSANGSDVSVRTSFVNGTAQTEGNQGTAKIATSHQFSPQAIVLPNGVFSLYAALADRLSKVTAGAELKAYILPLAEIGVRVVSDQPERIQVGTSFLNVQRYDLLFNNPGGDLAVSLTAGDGGRLIRLSIPAQAIEVVREDVASPTSRTQVFSNPGDEAVVIPAVGFNLGATITRPSPPAARMPAVILLSGSSVGDRDGFVQGVPTLAHLAGAIADARILAVRYDKRGFGQSGGRAESATIQDYAEDVRAVVRWLLQRKDIDPKRIALVGHSEGAWVALLAAAREKRVGAVASIAGPATTGADLVLAQQQRALDQMKLTPDEREKKVALQKQIQTAVITGKGWELVPQEERRAADTPWFQSLLAFDPAKVLKDIRQPLFFVHGALDKQVPPAHADLLADMARKQSDSESIDVVVVRGVNHLLIPAFTGEVTEYASLTDRNVSKDVSGALTAWLTKTFAAIK